MPAALPTDPHFTADGFKSNQCLAMVYFRQETALINLTSVIPVGNAAKDFIQGFGFFNNFRKIVPNILFKGSGNNLSLIINDQGITFNLRQGYVKPVIDI